MNPIPRLLFCWVLVVGGCEYPSDKYQRSDWTRNQLQQLARVTVSLHEDGVDLSSIKTIAEMLSAADEKGLIEHQVKYFQTDAWQKSFRWQITKARSGGFTVSIVSGGRNGILEEGTGDDLSVKIEVVEGKPPKVTYNWR